MQFADGKPLPELADQIARAALFARQSANGLVVQGLKNLDKAVSALRGVSPSVGQSDQEAEDWVIEWQSHAFELKSAVFLGEFDQALRLGNRWAVTIARSYLYAEVTFHHALAAAAQYEHLDKDTQAATLTLIQDHLARLQGWAARIPDNFIFFQWTLAGELARLSGDTEQMFGHFDRAIASARQYGFTPVQGLAAERAANAAQRMGLRDEASAYLDQARAAYAAEKLMILATTLVIRRTELLRKLGIPTSMTAEVNLAVTSGFKRIRSRSQRAPVIEGILIDKSFCNRFAKCGFMQLFQYLHVTSDLTKRVRTSTDWLLESRREARLGAAVVKTAIALESLLVFSESESLARTLSERSAFILSNSPEMRRKISSIILRFYDVRSGIVHGSQKKVRKLTPWSIECVDRLTLMLHLVIASNSDLWPSVDSLRPGASLSDGRSHSRTSNFRFHRSTLRVL